MANLKKIALLSLAATTALMANGYKIPEQSQKGVALSSAYVANAHGADTSYYNPANMGFKTGDGALEMDLNYIHLTAVKFEGGTTSTESKKENFLIPTFYYVSPAVDNFRFGLALTSPVGLSKRWDEQPAKTWAEEFTLISYEINPTIAYKVNEKFSVAAGLRMIYSDGTVKSTAPAASASLTRDMQGNGLDFGYNLALTYKPLKELALAATYRSKIDMKLEGDATLSNTALGPYAAGTYSGSASVRIPAPATLNLAAAYTFDGDTTVEFVYDRTYWSTYRQLDFEYQGDRSAMSYLLVSNFDDPIKKNWEDSNCYRLGVTHRYDSPWTAMAGLVYYETPIPESDLGYDLPDSDGMAYSLGARYAFSEQIELGASLLYADRKDRTVSEGEFSNSAVYFLSLGVEYKF